MKRSPRARNTPFTFSESIHRQLTMYALAASAAGVGVLALSSPAGAKIVYTPVNVRAWRYYLDLNHDGITDFYFNANSASVSNGSNGIIRTSYLGVGGARGESNNNAVAGKSNLAGVLWPGEEIGPKRQFGAGVGLIEHWRQESKIHGTTTSTLVGKWANGGKGFKAHYLGLKFFIKGKVHYGWARLTTTDRPRGAVLTGYAYETIPGKAIIAGQTKGEADELRKEGFGPSAVLTNPIPATPQPASLGVLALGAQGVPLRRKDSTLEGN